MRIQSSILRRSYVQLVKAVVFKGDCKSTNFPIQVTLKSQYNIRSLENQFGPSTVDRSRAFLCSLIGGPCRFHSYITLQSAQSEIILPFKGSQVKTVGPLLNNAKEKQWAKSIPLRDDV